MSIEIIQLNVREGDRRRKIDTSTKEGRVEVATLIKENLRDGAAIFVAAGGNDFRVTGYDLKNDELIVRKNETRRGRQTFRIPANGASVNIVPPTAGG